MSLNNLVKFANAFVDDYSPTAYTGSYMERVFDPSKVQLQNDAYQAQINRDWQEYMSNTAYQRATEDMRKAGLNPFLAYSNGGASTPAGATASGMNYGTSQQFMRIVGTALDIARMSIARAPKINNPITLLSPPASKSSPNSY